MKTNLIKAVCNAVALAMGVTVVVTNIISPLSSASLTSLLGLGVAALGIAAFQK